MTGERKKIDLNKALKPPTDNPVLGTPLVDVPPEFHKFLKTFLQKRGGVLKGLADYDKKQ